MKESILAVRKAVDELDLDGVTGLVRACLDEGASPEEIFQDGITAGLEIVGRKFEEGEYFLADLIMAGEVVKEAMPVLKERMSETGNPGRGKVILATVAGDIHEIGKNIVGMILSANGYEVIDLGVDVPVKTFIDKTAELKPDIVGAGCYMSTTMLEMKDIISGLKAKGLRGKVKVMVGGVPTSQEFADEVGADAWGKDALDATAKALKLVGR